MTIMSIPKQGYVYPIDHLLYRRIYCIDYFSLPFDRENQENPLIALEWSYEKPYDFFRNTQLYPIVLYLLTEAFDKYRVDLLA